jgi:hypothetical protein
MRFAKTCSEVGEGGLAGQLFHGKASVCAVGSSPVRISKQGKDIVAIEMTFEVAKESMQRFLT